MDIAYIYTWKRDAPMRFYFRVVKNMKAIAESARLNQLRQQQLLEEQQKQQQLSDESKENEQQNNQQTKNNSQDQTTEASANLAEKKTPTSEQPLKPIEANNNSKPEDDKSPIIKNEEKKERIKLKIDLTKHQGNMVRIISGDSGSPVKKSLSPKSGSPNKIPPMKIMKPFKAKDGKSFLNKLKLKEIKQKVKESAQLLQKAKSIAGVDLKKSEFLNSFQLAPKPVVASLTGSPKSSKSGTSSPKESGSKRKNKDPMKLSKKHKVDDIREALDRLINKKAQQAQQAQPKDSISFNLAPLGTIGTIDTTQPADKTLAPASTVSASIPASTSVTNSTSMAVSSMANGSTVNGLKHQLNSPQRIPHGGNGNPLTALPVATQKPAPQPYRPISGFPISPVTTPPTDQPAPKAPTIPPRPTASLPPASNIPISQTNRSIAPASNPPSFKTPHQPPKIAPNPKQSSGQKSMADFPRLADGTRVHASITRQYSAKPKSLPNTPNGKSSSAAQATKQARSMSASPDQRGHATSNGSMKRTASPNGTEPVFKKPMGTPKKASPVVEPPKTSHLKKIAPADAKPQPVPSPQGQQQMNTPQKPNQQQQPNYLNYALMNSVKNPTHYRIQRTPIYSPFSPVYTPNSPSYTPNFSAPSKPAFKYASPLAYNNLMSELQSKKDLFVAPTPVSGANNMTPSAGMMPNLNMMPIFQSSPATPGDDVNKAMTPKTSPVNAKTPPPVDRKSSPPNNLLDKLNFPSSLSVTLTTETDDSKSKSPTGPKQAAAVNNYIEIVKLPETGEAPLSPPKSIIKIDDLKKSGENVQKDIISRVNEMCSGSSAVVTTCSGTGTTKTSPEKYKMASVMKPDPTGKDSFQNKFLQSILPRLGINEKGGSIDLFPTSQKTCQELGKPSLSPPSTQPSPLTQMKEMVVRSNLMTPQNPRVTNLSPKLNSAPGSPAQMNAPPKNSPPMMGKAAITSPSKMVPGAPQPSAHSPLAGATSQTKSAAATPSSKHQANSGPKSKTTNSVPTSKPSPASKSKSELRKISPKPAPATNRQTSADKSPAHAAAQQRQMSMFPQQPMPNAMQAAAQYDPAKLATIFTEFARASQQAQQQVAAAAAAGINFMPQPQMPPPPTTPQAAAAFNYNVMQQAYLLDQWSKLQKNVEGNLLENYIQSAFGRQSPQQQQQHHSPAQSPTQQQQNNHQPQQQ